jgi:hypothetical protein
MISKKPKEQQSGIKKVFTSLYMDNFIYGAILGLIAPVCGFLWYRVKMTGPLSLKETFQWLRLNPTELTALMTSSLLINVALFTIFINGRRDKTSIGIFLVTVIYAASVMTFKFA